MNTEQNRRPQKVGGLAIWMVMMALSLCTMAFLVVGLSGCDDTKPASSSASNDSQVTQPTDTGVVSSGEVNTTGPVTQNTPTAAPSATTAATTATSTATATKSNDELALEVINGDWGNGQDRIDALTNAGYDASAIQQQVNEIIYSDPGTYGDADDESDDVSDGSQVTWHDRITEDVYEDVPVYATKYCYTYSATACHGVAITPPIAATSGYDYDNDADAMATGNTDALAAIRAAGYDAQTLADCDCTVTTGSASVQTGTDHVKTGTRVVQEEGWY